MSMVALDRTLNNLVPPRLESQLARGAIIGAGGVPLPQLCFLCKELESPDLPMRTWHVYICDKGGRLYTGITNDLKHRLGQHGRPELLYTESHTEKTSAARRERQIKRWSRTKKLALVRANLDK